MNRHDLISPREKKNGQTHWQKVGAAFARDNGGFSLVFDALPLPDKEGNVRVLMVEPRKNDAPQQQREQPRQEDPASGGPQQGNDDMDSEIPF